MFTSLLPLSPNGLKALGEPESYLPCHYCVPSTYYSALHLVGIFNIYLSNGWMDGWINEWMKSDKELTLKHRTV